MNTRRKRIGECFAKRCRVQNDVHLPLPSSLTASTKFPFISAHISSLPMKITNFCITYFVCYILNTQCQRFYKLFCTSKVEMLVVTKCNDVRVMRMLTCIAFFNAIHYKIITILLSVFHIVAVIFKAFLLYKAKVSIIIHQLLFVKKEEDSYSTKWKEFISKFTLLQIFY